MICKAILVTSCIIHVGQVFYAPATYRCPDYKRRLLYGLATPRRETAWNVQYAGYMIHCITVASTFTPVTEELT